jgi:hypothetical protein
MHDTLTLPNDLAASQQLMARLAVHIRALENESGARESALPVSDSHLGDQSSQSAVQVSPLTSNPMSSPGSPALPAPQRAAESLQASRPVEFPPLSARLEDLVARSRGPAGRTGESDPGTAGRSSGTAAGCGEVATDAGQIAQADLWPPW